MWHYIMHGAALEHEGVPWRSQQALHKGQEWRGAVRLCDL